MRTLHHLMAGEAISRPSIVAWPFDDDATGPAGWPDGPSSVVCEIYPTLFRRAATGRTDKLKQRDRLAAAVGCYGATLAEDVPDPMDDHTGDAVITAAGLARVAADPALWHAPRQAGIAERTRREGWIFGVTAPPGVVG